MKKTLLLHSILLSLILCAPTITFGQKAVISGKIMDEQKLSLPGATVKITPGNQYTISDVYGKFEFLNVTPGTYQLEATYMGYRNFSQNITVESGGAGSFELIMEEGGLDINEVVVLGDRLKGQAKALNQQRNNDNITNIISSDQVGRFPDSNIGDALKRVPGITMQNDQGEARNIIVRGLAPELNSVTLNGDRIPSAEGDNRRVQMDLIPSDMISTIEVNKTLTPDMDADAIGGSVNLVTRAAPNSQRISATLSSGFNPIRSKALYTGGFVYANRFAKKAIGMVLSGSYNNNNYGSDDVEAVWAKDDFGNVFINETDIRKYDVQRIRRSLSAAFDFKLGQNHTITANAMYNWRDDIENRYRLQIDDIEPVYDDNDKITGFEGRVGRQTKGGIDNNKNKGGRLERQTVQNYSVRGDHLLSPKVDLDWSVSYSTASEDRPNERYIGFREGGNTLTYNGDSRAPLVSPVGLDATTLGLHEITENHDFTEETELGAKLNLRFPLSMIPNQKGRMRVGARLRLKTKDRNNNFFEYTPVNEDDIATIGDAGTVNWPGKKFQAGSHLVPGLFASKGFLGNLNLSNTGQFEAESVPGEFLGANYNAKENIVAGYVRFDQDFNEKLSMIIGARFENTSINYTGNIIEDEEELAGARSVENTYLNVLPSVSFRYNATDNFILRAAATTALARPNYYALAPYISIIPGDQEISAGNPDLKATYSWNFDLMAENYFESVGLISGGVFYKNLKNFIYTYRNQQYSQADFTAGFPSVTNPISAGQQWDFLQSRNGDNVNIFGFELAFQRQLDFLPGFLKNFGIYTNYTFTKSFADGVYNEDGHERTDVSLPGTAPHMFNASLSWENKRFSARLSANYTAAYLDALGGEDFDDIYYDKQFFLDANAAYKITKNLRLFAEANNLTNQPLRYYQSISARTVQAEYYRPRFNFGLKFDMTK
ncbi:TonB-dependent receptor [Dyadobacter fanqingshengii]|uniref:TonB-dependent receptor n=1 Tax=Dyadobacter fanqingshengii TaxID=2906443 RepID=A0A9X1P9T5_9BACT|nr:TonB-dependent receptor [Dyadobacter fanqingshengii]MCF0041289.1 TonB-dependent receptor [Dyadobacter fanqingshengii]USJ36986.1 TonB-dependent receptor [Dyadobacter fanqingshengii]